MSKPGGAASDELLRVDNLRIEYFNARTTCVVDDVSFRIGRGDIYGLAGESGSGKTTIGQGLLRLLRPPAAITGGSIILDGEDVDGAEGTGHVSDAVDVMAMNRSELRAFRWEEIAIVLQSAMNALNPVMTIGEQLSDVFEVHEGATRRAALTSAGGLLELVGIDRARLAAYPHQLSGGMRQRVVIAMALALRPPLVIMDEPTTALDVVVQREILGQIVRLQAELGFSVLFISHDLSLMLELCSHVGILRHGKLVEEGPARALFADPRHPYTQELLRSVMHA